MRFAIKRHEKLPLQKGDVGNPTSQRSAWNKRPEGAGDLVALVAKPTARFLDRIFRTRLANCMKCDGRRRKLNELIPF